MMNTDKHDQIWTHTPKYIKNVSSSSTFNMHVHVVRSPDWPGMGVTKPISSVPLYFQIFSTVKTHVNYKIWRSYLTGVNAAELRRHLPNIYVI